MGRGTPETRQRARLWASGPPQNEQCPRWHFWISAIVSGAINRSVTEREKERGILCMTKRAKRNRRSLFHSLSLDCPRIRGKRGVESSKGSLSSSLFSPSLSLPPREISRVKGRSKRTFVKGIVERAKERAKERSGGGREGGKR